tara:strand:+ start:3723 stop:5249 length:1527 start_codon:yes stop_codon:yes gene_type:complete
MSSEIKSVNRSSAIFPFIVSKSFSTKVHFLSYWFLKRGIEKIQLVISLRCAKGKLLVRKNSSLDKTVKAHCISVCDYLKLGHKNIFGSIEIEVFSDQNLIYPYPAFVVNFETKNSSSFVHSCGRTFNNEFDKKNNTKFLPEESGFDILPNTETKPFFSFVNSNETLLNKTISIQVVNVFGEILRKKIIIKKLNKYETKFIFFLDDNEKLFLKDNKATIRIKHNFKNFFPRFLAGNLCNQLTRSSLTHSYYDVSKFNREEHYWKNTNKFFFLDAVLSFPVFSVKIFFTEIVIYPIYPKTNGISFDLKLYKKNGKNIKIIKNFLKIPNLINAPIYIKINDLVLKNVNIKELKDLVMAKLIIKGKKIPARLKFGLNVGHKVKESMPCNICFNALLPSKRRMDKPTSFKWAPIFNKFNYKFYLFNASFLKNDFKKTDISMKFWRQSDTKFITKKIKLYDNGTFLFNLNKNKKIKNFLKNKSGWVTIVGDSPYLTGFYFQDNSCNLVSGDHFF